MREPALTAKEWETWRTYGYVERGGQMILHSKGLGLRGTPRVSALVAPMDTETHACAALCLDGQEFGFTHEDVRGLRMIASAHPAFGAAIEDIADRIAALLPPEKP